MQILTVVLATVPTIVSVLIDILINGSRMSDLRASMDDRFRDLRGYIDARFDAVDKRFVEMKDMWRSELHRVEEVFGARLKHAEER